MENNTISNFTQALNSLFTNYEINTCLRQRHFLAQSYHETQYFTLSIEANNRYTSNYDPYRGRGFIHLSTKNNYKKYKNSKGIDIVANYSRVATDMNIAADTAGFYWIESLSGKNINLVADVNRSSVKNITKEVNAAALGSASRQEAFDILKDLFDIDECLKC